MVGCVSYNTLLAVEGLICLHFLWPCVFSVNCLFKPFAHIFFWHVGFFNHLS